MVHGASHERCAGFRFAGLQQQFPVIGLAMKYGVLGVVFDLSECPSRAP